MKKKWPHIGSVILSIWALVCMVIFMYFPGAISQIQDATLYDISSVPEKLSRITPLQYFIDILLAVAGIAFYAVSCISLGAMVSAVLDLGRTKYNEDPSWKDALLPTYFLVGNAVFSVLFLTLAMTISLTRISSALILIGGLLSGLGKFRKLTIPKLSLGNGYEKGLAISSIILLLVSVFHSSARLSYDASAMYLSVAKLTALENQVNFYMEHAFPISVLHSVMQSSAILQVFGDQTARMLSWLFGVVIISFTIGLAKFGRVSRMAIRILPVLILTSTAFLDQMGDGKVDLFGTAYSLAALYWMAMGIDNDKHGENGRVFLLSGFFIGFSSVLRPYNAILLGLYALVYFVQGFNLTRQSITLKSRQLLWMILGAVGFGIYHLLINRLILNDAFAFLNILRVIDPASGPWDYKPESEWLNKLLYPFVVTFKNSGASLGNITPLAVAFLPALALPEIRKGIELKTRATRLVISACIALAIWVLSIFTVVEVRYVMFLWIVIFFFIAEIIARAVDTHNLAIKGLAICSILILLGFMIIRSLYISFSTYSPIDTDGNPNCFDTDHCHIITSINETAGEGARVLTLSGLRYYLRSDLFACSTDHEDFKIFQNLNLEDEEEFWLEIYRRGYEYIALEEGYVTDSALIRIIPGPDNTPPWVVLEQIFGKPGDNKMAYRIHVNDPPINAELVCEQNNSTSKWEIVQISP